MASLSTRNKAPQPPASAEDSSAFGPIAERFRRAGDLDRAVSLCRDGLRKFPNHISARVTLGWALLELGKYDEAREELEQVLRRRPDNLAAIRALAELHDRSEHTLNLPMDGPGQWPPSDDAVEQAAITTRTHDEPAADQAEVVEEPELLQSGHGHAASYTSPESVTTPPDLGLAMWSPAPEPEPQPELAHAAHDNVAAVKDDDVDEVDIAALIAEAESLEAAAQSDNSSSAPVLDEELDLGAVDLSALMHPIESPTAVAIPEAIAPAVVFVAPETPAIEPFEAVAPEEFFAEAPAHSPEPSQPAELPSVMAFTVEPLEAMVSPEPFEAMAAPEPFEAMAAPEPFEAVAPEELFAEAPAQSPASSQPLELPSVVAFAVEPFEAIAAPEPFEAMSTPEPVEAFAAEPQVVAESLEAFESVQFAEEMFALIAPEPADQVVELDAEVTERQPDPDVQPALRFDLEPEVAAVPVVPVVPVVPESVIALERFLSRVQARRTQLMAESVA